ncbi:lipid IV(A) 3-deoxy-D-manno-octulosonic acid transferase [Sedimenticola selenatireducens]|uniref:3-deoxy-D-manno-octulosonic acid transferase n=1 Tax=Sedimenticola selenatireducens TaxID=191960 RepID=A0A557S4V5_9GAMM|nr:lipid IV(A) 3-deoxy-D-manno-octulosonic acid transferase [Sedimenticola selenatireducens]TVO72444.1 3-deoxy-D-manno-octulosonic acid transferase [Sedimenticola selenatireducens]TVT64699.1 MAG: 3-deoxy-D-manno-octulosonic acid transferase [Sedimenticola selenatireducens]
MEFLYTIILYLSLPVILLRLYWRSLKNPKYRSRIGERFGRVSIPAINNCLWLHTVSVGETQAAEPLVRKLQETYPDLQIVITTTTPTGADRVKKLFGDSVIHLYFPYDLPFAVRGFLNATRPKLLVMMETEIWPNLLAECELRAIPTILANARLSERSAKGYARLGVFSRQTFGRIGMVAAQSPADAERFLGLGVQSDRVRVAGSIKFDIRVPAIVKEQAEALRRTWGGRPVWVAASTREGEEELILAAHRKVMQQLPQALLVIVPRHPERFDKIALLCQRDGFTFARRSLNDLCRTETAVFLGDTMGELMLFLSAADVAFVGGSLVPTGGHNVLEPAALGLPVVFGPHMFNFAMISRMLLAENAAVEVSSYNDLSRWVIDWLSDANLRAAYGENALRVVEANRGAMDRLFDILQEYL